MLAYANAPDITDEKQRADGYGIARFNTKTGDVTFEAWPRFSDVTKGNEAQFPGWPINFNTRENDGRTVVGKLPPLGEGGVVQVINESTKEIIYTTRAKKGFAPPVYVSGKYTVKFGKDKPETTLHEEILPST